MRILSKINLIITLLLFSILCGCKNNPTNPSASASFYPVAVGNNWEYNYIEFDSLGIKTNEKTIKESLIHYRIKDDLIVFQIYSPLNPKKPSLL